MGWGERSTRHVARASTPLAQRRAERRSATERAQGKRAKGASGSPAATTPSARRSDAPGRHSPLPPRVPSSATVSGGKAAAYKRTYLTTHTTYTLTAEVVASAQQLGAGSKMQCTGMMRGVSTPRAAALAGSRASLGSARALLRARSSQVAAPARRYEVSCAQQPRGKKNGSVKAPPLKALAMDLEVRGEGPSIAAFCLLCCHCAEAGGALICRCHRSLRRRRLAGRMRSASCALMASGMT